eukprot:SAG31_NODE_1634_length_7683_cov_10.287843_2_plen_89_part_00
MRRNSREFVKLEPASKRIDPRLFSLVGVHGAGGLGDREGPLLASINCGLGDLLELPGSIKAPFRTMETALQSDQPCLQDKHIFGGVGY